MPRTQINCPNCRQPVVVNLKQLFDVGANPADKQFFLSGSANMIDCPKCGFRGALGTPIVYHDPDKELLLTYVPQELGLPRDEQERAIGPLLKEVMDKLPMEKRKAYLLNPQAFLTFQSLVERVLLGDGITKEVIQAQQQRIAVIQRLMNAASDEAMDEIIKNDESLLDEEFFTLFSSLTQSAVESNDEQTAKRFIVLQDKLLRATKAGQEILSQAREIQEARISLEEAGEQLTREKLLDLVLEAPNDIRINALVSYARPIMDYNFFQALTDRAAKAAPDEQERIIRLRGMLLEITGEYDKELEQRLAHASKNVETLLGAEDIERAVLQNLPIVDQYFMQALNSALDNARKAGDLEKSTKINRMMEVVRQITTPPEVALMESLLDAADDEAVKAAMQENKIDVTQDFLDFLNHLLNQASAAGDEDMKARAERVLRVAQSMEK